jgi:hypothetical protein
MNFLEKFTNDINKSVANGIYIGTDAVKNVIDIVGSSAQNTVLSSDTTLNKELSSINKGINSAARKGENIINSKINNTLNIIDRNNENLIKKEDKLKNDINTAMYISSAVIDYAVEDLEKKKKLAIMKITKDMENVVNKLNNKQYNVVNKLSSDMDNVLNKINSEQSAIVNKVSNEVNRITYTLNSNQNIVVNMVSDEIDKALDKINRRKNELMNDVINEIDMVIDKIKRKESTTVNNIAKEIDNVVQKIDNKQRDVINKMVSEMDRIVNKIQNQKFPESDIDKRIIKTTNNAVRGYNSFIDSIYRSLFNTLIKPFDPKARMSQRDYDFGKIIGTFILLFVGYISSLFYDNTIKRVITSSEKLIGYKLDGRKIGKSKPTQSTKLPLLMKIIKTILSIFATLLDLILLVLTNQTDIFANMVKSLLGK